MALGLEEVAKYIYIVYSFFCHQIHYRSLHLFDYQFAWCTRDTFIWIGLLTAGLFVKFRSIRAIKWYEVLIFVIPIALDGGIQLIATMLGFSTDKDVFYASTNLSRMLTGAFFGVGLGLWIFPMIDMAENINLNKKNASLWGSFLKIYAVNFVIYLVLIGLWFVTSNDYKPHSILDHKSRLPDEKSQWLTRRQNATCPVNTQEESFVIFNCEE